RTLPLPITTPKLVLRRFTPGDWKDLLECAEEESEENILRWLERDSQVKLTTPEQAFFLGIELPAEGKLIGYLSLTFSDPERRQAMLSFSLNKNYQGQDFALEAIHALLGFCFEGISLHRAT